MKKIIITYGIIAGAIVTSFMAYSAFQMDKGSFQHSMLLGYTAMLVAYVFVFLGVKSFRDKYSDGIITFGKGLKIGMLISLVAATIYVGVWLIEYYCFYPDFMDKYTDAMMKDWEKAGLTAAELKAKATEMQGYKEMYRNPVMVILWTYAEILVPIGLLVPVISALILKRKEKLT